MVNCEQLMQAAEQQMPSKRWEHTLGVIQTAVKLAKQYGGNPEKAEIAAILHDYVKFWPVEKMREVIIRHNLPSVLFDYDKELWHAPVGACVVSEQFGIDDEEILDAIRYHTSGRERMTLLDKIVCLADYMEPGRNFPGVEHIRELAEQSLEKALISGFDSTIQFLLQKGKPIFPLTVLARNSLIQQLNESESR